MLTSHPSYIIHNYFYNSTHITEQSWGQSEGGRKVESFIIEPNENCGPKERKTAIPGDKALSNI
jgi:hypothetical protein